MKKGTEECRYELRDHEATHGDSTSPHEMPAVNDPQPDANTEIDRMSTAGLITNPRESPDLDLPGLSGTLPRPVSAALRADLDGPIDWSTMRIERDSSNDANRELIVQASQTNFVPIPRDLYPLPKAASRKYLEAYYAHFHHRWTIVHSPSLEMKSHTSLILSSMKMIGAWLSGNQEAKWLAVAMHERLMSHVLPRFLQNASKYTTEDASLMSLFQVALYNIIFALYCGAEDIVSRALFLKNILVTALREIGFFDPEVTFDDPKIFLPLRILKHEDRQRLAAYLYKIDAYFSILHSQPPALAVEDLHYALPSTYALHNANGLHIFDTRYSIEPAARSHTTMCNLIQVIAQKSEILDDPTDGLMLAEDVQLGICSLQARLWHRSMKSHMPDFSTVIELNHIKNRLETWRQWLNRIDISETDASGFTAERHWAMRFYYGLEDHTKSGWYNMVYNRQKSLVYDGIALYHLSHLHLYSNIRILSHLSKDLMPQSGLEGSGEVRQQAHQYRLNYVKEWAKASNSRRSLCHAAAIIGFYCDMTESMRESIDPIIYIALTVGALVVWAYESFAIHNCQACTPGLQNQRLPDQLSPIELAKWADITRGPALEKEKEDWIEEGDGLVLLRGMILCRCTLKSIVALYQSCVPVDWKIARTIAPGLVKNEVPDIAG